MMRKQRIGSGRSLTPGATLAAFAASVLAPALTAAEPTAVTRSGSQQIESAIETALILTDKDAVTLGALQFDPGSFVGVESEDFGSSESVNRRRKVRTFVLPWRWDTDNVEHGFSPYMRARLMYFEAEQDVVYRPETPPEGQQEGGSDSSKSRVYGGFLGGGTNYRFSEHWKASLGAGLHLVRYQNDHEYNSVFSRAAAAELDGVLFNSSVNTLIGSVRTNLTYQDQFGAFPWSLSTTYTYYSGEAVSSGRTADEVEPETWSWVNSVYVHADLLPISGVDNRLRYSAKRIDVGGEVQRTLATDHYYELGIGWLFNMSGDSSWVDNIGALVSVNVGSALSGGSVSILYNESW